MSTPSESHTKSVLKSAVVLSLFLLGFCHAQALPAHSSTLVLTLYGTMGGWGLTPDTITSPGPLITVTPGQQVVLTLVSADGVRHNFGVDYNGNGVPDLGEPLSPDFGGSYPATISYSFNATSIPGTYTYLCYYHAGSQWGRFVVQASQPPTLSLTLYGKMSGWGLTKSNITSPGPLITVDPGEQVSLTLVSADGITHNFGVDYNGNGVPDPGEPLSPDFGGSYPTTISYTFNATTVPGTYIYLCYYHSASQWGRFVVRGNQPPVASFTFQPQNSVMKEEVLFNASSSRDPDGTISGYQWLLGDGASGSGVVVSHAYQSAGNYTVVLTVTDNGGARSSTAVTVEVTRPAPVADFSFSPVNPHVGQSVLFNATMSSDVVPGDSLSQYRWSFGDGNTTMTVGPLVLHRYDTEGTFNAALTVNDSIAPQMIGVLQKRISVAKALHDVAVLSVTPSALSAQSGEAERISVVLKNMGTVPETFDVTLFLDSTVVQTENVALLGPGANRTVVFTWNTAGFQSGNHSLSVEAILADDPTPSDNTANIPFAIDASPASSPSPSSVASIVVAVAVVGGGVVLFMSLRARIRSSKPSPRDSTESAG